ncbi:TadE/TadG family type IV pilus assembly protein [Fredinandcohnia humi]
MEVTKQLQNEEGSATIEFLAMVPLVFFIMMVFWQFLVAGYAVMVAQSAVNEVAKTYATTGGDYYETELVARELIDDAGGNLSFDSIVPTRSGKNFELTLHVKLDLVFVPDKYVGSLPDIPFSRSINSRVMD